MRRFTVGLFILMVFGANCIAADETVSAAQTKLKDEGFFVGEPNGEFTSDTSAAVTRFQIRNGLQINGTLDQETTRALGIAAENPEAQTPKVGEDVWRYLRKSDQEYIERLLAAKPGRQVKPAEKRVYVAKPPSEGPASHDAVLGGERLNDYVGAFVLAGVNARVGSELEFFADRVEYFDQGMLNRERIQRDLEQYDRRWPERRFRLAGPLQVDRQSNGRLRVSFPLRYELRNASKNVKGIVRKALLLERVGDDLQIVAVHERRGGL